MDRKKILTVSILISLLMSGTIGVINFEEEGGLPFPPGMEMKASTGSIPEHKEYTQPSRVETEEISYFTKMDIYYDYQMDHDVPPKDLIFHLNGTDYQDELVQIEIRLKRPDGENITLIDEQIGDNKTIEERYNFFKSVNSRDNIYEFGSRFEDAPPTAIDYNRTAFGKADEDMISDPEVLKGEYTIQISLFGRDLDIRHGENDTVLKVLGLPPGPVQDLGAQSTDEEITLNWKPPVDKGGSEVIRYNIYRASTNKPFKFLDNVSADTTKYTDTDVKSRTLYFYKVAPINLDTEGVERGDMSGDIQNPDWRSNCERVIAFPSSEDKKESSTNAYRWLMDYSYLTEDYIEEKMRAAAEVHNKISGQGKCLYKIDEKKEKDGLKRFAYEGGYYSSGEANVSLEYEDTTFDIEAEVKETSIDFSGEIWVNSSDHRVKKNKTIYGIERQTLDCSGRVDMEYEYKYRSGGKYQSSTVDLEMNWSHSLEIDFEEPGGWLSIDSHEISFSGISNCNFSGDVSGDIHLDMDNEGTYSNRTVQLKKSLNPSIDGKNSIFGSPDSTGRSRLYSPILGSAKIGYYKILDEAVGIGNNEIGDAVYSENLKEKMAFYTNNQPAQISEEDLYKKQYLDPTTMPGLLSILEAGFIRANFSTSSNLEDMISEKIKMKMYNNPELRQLNASELERWRENETERLKNKYYSEILTEPCWQIWDQQSGVDGTFPSWSKVPILDVVGYFESESVEKSEVDKFLEDKEGYTKESEEERINWDWIVLSVLVLITVIFAAIYRSRKKRA